MFSSRLALLEKVHGRPRIIVGITFRASGFAGAAVLGRRDVRPTTASGCRGRPAILRIGRPLLPVIIGAAPTLTRRPAAYAFAEDDKRRAGTNFGSKDNGETGSSQLLRDHGMSL